RIYDPLIGRFMSADPFIQAPGNLQSYNRYAYVLNNPLAYTDPSGYISLKKLVRMVVTVVVAYYTGGMVSGAYLNSVLAGSTFTIGGSVGLTAGILGGAAGGFAAGLVSGGSLKAGVQGAFTGGLFGAAGTVGGWGEAAANSMERYAAHAAAGCVSSVAGGGKCGSGAGSALFGKFATNHVGSPGQKAGLGEVVGKGVATSVAGGVGSVIGGGKFANGAETAAYGYMFNEVLTNAKGERFKSTGRLYRPDPTLGGQMELTQSEAEAVMPYVKAGLVFVPQFGIRLVGVMDGLEGYANFKQEKYNELTSSAAASIIATGLQAASGGLQRTATLIGQGYEKLFNQSTWPGVVNGDKSGKPQ
ncbi:MAG: RHS repeat-associated core domain-containing protein, partial [Hydrogenophaga sp.]|uniref:RHS repeat-associated core domain-containing protein n=1 Tax=Hydrogenophaga sp. TaxID=1904254 RepID=UPI003D0D736D